MESSLQNSTSPQAFRLGGTSLRLPATGEVYPTPPFGQGVADCVDLIELLRNFKTGKSLALCRTGEVTDLQPRFRDPSGPFDRYPWKNRRSRRWRNWSLGCQDSLLGRAAERDVDLVDRLEVGVSLGGVAVLGELLADGLVRLDRGLFVS